MRILHLPANCPHYPLMLNSWLFKLSYTHPGPANFPQNCSRRSKWGATVSLPVNQVRANMHQFQALPSHIHGDMAVLFPPRQGPFQRPVLSSSLPVPGRQSRRYYLGRFKRRFRSEPNLKPLTSRIVDLTRRRQLHQVSLELEHRLVFPLISALTDLIEEMPSSFRRKNGR